MARNEIDALYDKIVRGVPDEENQYLRMPATQREAEVVITPEVIQKMPGLKYPRAENYRQNINDSLTDREALSSKLMRDIPELSQSASESKAQARESFQNLNKPLSTYTPNAEIEKAIKLNQDQANAPINAERSLLEEGIISLAPIVGALALGENAQLGLPQTMSGIRSQYEGQRKEKLEYLKNARENAAKRVIELQKLKTSDREAWDKIQDRELKRNADLVSSNLKFAEMDNKDLDDAVKRFQEAEVKFAEAREKGAKEYADISGTPEEMAAKEKRAKIMASLAQQKIDKPTEGERKGAFQLGLMQQAEQNLNDLQKKHGDFPSMNNKWFRLQKNIASGMFGTTLMSDFLNSKMIDDPTRQQIMAELQFLEGIGRIQSGAAISLGEWNSMREQYFPTYGDNDETKAMKAQQRNKALEGVNIIAGKAAPLVSAPKQVATSEYPRTVRKGSQQATVSNAKELKEAQSEGWK